MNLQYAYEEDSMIVQLVCYKVEQILYLGHPTIVSGTALVIVLLIDRTLKALLIKKNYKRKGNPSKKCSFYW